MDHFTTARTLMSHWKGDGYLCGNGVLDSVGRLAARAPYTGGAPTAALVYADYPGVAAYVDRIVHSLSGAGVRVSEPIPGAAPNAPKDDVRRIADRLGETEAGLVVSFGGGSTIDAVKAAEVVRALGGSIDAFFGTDRVSATLAEGGKTLRPHMAIQTAASTGAHLTKYSNVTDAAAGQKKLIVDPAIVPAYPVFDFEVTHSAPPDLTADGALDGVSHILEVLFGSVGKPAYSTAAEIAVPGISLILEHLPRVMRDPGDRAAREALCLATDLGGYAIMVGGTNGAHLTSFSLVDVLSHGRACALMNPYYTVFFAPAIEEPLRLVAELYRAAGHLSGDPSRMDAKRLGVAVAEAMISFAKSIGFPTTLGEVSGFTAAHVDRALAAAKDPQLRMKLENMPVPLTAAMVDDYMGPVLAAARSGDLGLIRHVEA